MRLDIVDVFAEHPLEGNPLAVVREAGELDSARMQAMAREMNLSETTFVLSESQDRARVRIFTPAQELPFAGHPTLGTAWVLGRDRDRYTLELDGGDLEVRFEDGIAWMAPPATELHETLTPEDVASRLGLDPADLDPEFAARRGSVGIEFLFVGLASLDALGRLSPTLEELHSLPAFSLFAFTAQDGAGSADYAARMFFEAGGIREDPATGSANSVFAAYLMERHGPDFDLRVDQGVEMGRPSRIHLEARAGKIRVGGRVQPVVSGEWVLP